MNKAVLVAGGAGYIGSHVCKALAAAGYVPVVLDNLSSGHEAAVRFGPLVRACVSDVAAVSEAITRYDIEAVIDLAGSIEVAESVRDPLKYYDNNVARKIPFMRVLQACGVRVVVISSSASVYGEPMHIPISESHLLVPNHPYGWSKLWHEQVVRDVRLCGGPAWIALRYFNAAGASEDLDIGEDHQPETHLIPLACHAALGLSPALNIYGDGSAVRDFIHVTDLADAHVLALGALLAGKPPRAYNLGSGKGFSVNEVLACFARLGYPVPHQFVPARSGDPSRLVADSTAAKRDLSWSPRYTDIETIICSAYKWHKRKI
jgi:UDP-arabinose 4-epimerase